MIPMIAPTQTSAGWCLLSVILLIEEVAAMMTSPSWSQNLSRREWEEWSLSWRYT